MRWPALPLLVCALGCTDPPPPAAPSAPSAPASPALSPSPPAPASDRALGPPTARDLVFSLSPSQLALVAALSTMCQPVVTASPPARVGCACCPPFDECAPSPGVPLQAGDPVEPAAVITGALTAPGKRQMAVAFAFCREHGTEATLRVVEPTSSGPRQVAERPVTTPSLCVNLHRKGETDLVVCKAESGASGHMVTTVGSFAMTGDEQTLVRLDDTQGERCSPGTVVLQRSLRSMRARDVDGDGVDELELLVEVRDGVVPPGGEARCDRRESIAPLTELSLRFAHKAGKLHPDSDSARLLTGLRAFELRREAQRR